jgi:hypothetical protein
MTGISAETITRRVALAGASAVETVEPAAGKLGIAAVPRVKNKGIRLVLESSGRKSIAIF